MGEIHQKELESLAKELEKELGLKKPKILPVWKGFLIFSKINKKTPSVLWLPNKKIYGIVNRKELINKIIDLSGLTISALIPYASEVRLLLLQAMPNPPQNSQVYVHNLHSVTIGSFSVTPDHKLPVLGQIKKTTKSFIKLGQRSVEGIVTAADSIIHRNKKIPSKEENNDIETSSSDTPTIQLLSLKFHSILDEKRHKKLALKVKDENLPKFKRVLSKIETSLSGPETNQFLCSDFETLEQFSKLLQKEKFNLIWTLNG
ncbi:MAG: hypothetical protein ACFFCQ_11230 [Promethearchaeota archaeon]